MKEEYVCGYRVGDGANLAIFNKDHPRVMSYIYRAEPPLVRVYMCFRCFKASKNLIDRRQGGPWQYAYYSDVEPIELLL